ncbi:unnamed protein product [Mytilus coruscus]|uniref:Uncharacterized protein n=1 Tax=Mytilus coruscus TaxID=42192 RepID=A0A6J8CCE3_MYTCO|nr:unnamed protein product [Mytilus coruscus]
MIRASAATKLNSKITSSSQSAHQADGSSPLTVPGDYIYVKIPTDIVTTDDIFFIEPHKNDSHENLFLVSSVAGNLRIPNLTDKPLVLKRNEHFCNVHSTYSPENDDIKSPKHAVAANSQLHKVQVIHSDLIRVDPDGLLQLCVKEKFEALLRQYDDVFCPPFKGYNGAVGALEAKVNMGPVQPPQRKGRIPKYSKTQLVTLQE